MSTGQVKAVVAFYRYYCVVPLLLNLFCSYLYCVDGSLFAVVMIKLVTDTGIRYFIIALQSDKLFYYYNRNISRAALWCGYFFVDFALLTIFLCLISLLK